MEALFTTHEVARYLSVNPSTITKWIDRRLLVAFRTPGGHRRVRRPDLVSFLKKHEMPIPDELGSAQVQLLVVDDDKAVLDQLRKAFKPYSDAVELFTTSSPAEALLLAAELKPHGFLVDTQMPDLSGIEICRAMRTRPELNGIRMVTMAQRFTQDTVEQSISAGAIACLPKPVAPTSVLELFRVPLSLAGRALG